MRALAVALASVLLLAAAVPAEGARHLRFSQAKRAKHGLKAAKSWRARRGAPAPIVAPVGEAPATNPPLAAAPVGEPAAPGSGEPAPSQPTDPPPPPPACDSSPWLGVTAEDVDGFRFRLSRTCVPAGTVLFQFRNVDASEHNLFAEGVDPVAPARRVVEDTEGETTRNGSADLAAGKWRLYCSFPGHESMSRVIDVTPPG